MAGHLQQELPISAFMQQSAFGRTLDRQTAQHKGPRGKADVRSLSFTINPDQLDCFRLAEFLLGNQQITSKSAPVHDEMTIGRELV